MAKAINRGTRGKPFEAGQDDRRQVGRPKGRVNKYTAALKDTILISLDVSGRLLLKEFQTNKKHFMHKYANYLIGDDEAVVYLVWLSMTKPAAYASLIGKTLPYTINHGRNDDDYVLSTVKQIRKDLEEQGIQVDDGVLPDE